MRYILLKLVQCTSNKINVAKITYISIELYCGLFKRVRTLASLQLWYGVLLLNLINFLLRK